MKKWKIPTEAETFSHRPCNYISTCAVFHWLSVDGANEFKVVQVLACVDVGTILQPALTKIYEYYPLLLL